MLDPWCDSNVISVLELESRVGQYLNINQHIHPDDVFITMSPDLYNELVKDASVKTKYSPPQTSPAPLNLMSYWLSSGQFSINAIPRYRNFLFIGTKDELERYEHAGVPAIFLSDSQRRKIDRDFEDIVLSNRGSLSHMWGGE